MINLVNLEVAMSDGGRYYHGDCNADAAKTARSMREVVRAVSKVREEVKVDYSNRGETPAEVEEIRLNAVVKFIEEVSTVAAQFE